MDLRDTVGLRCSSAEGSAADDGECVMGTPASWARLLQQCLALGSGRGHYQTVEKHVQLLDCKIRLLRTRPGASLEIK